MGEFPNVATQFKAGPEQVEIAKLGGKTVTEKRRVSAKLREIKKRVKKGQLKTGDEVWLLDRVENRDVMALDIMSFLDKTRKEMENDGGAKNIPLINTYTSILKSIHGERIQTENVHHVLHWMDNSKRDEIVVRLLKEKGDEK